MSVVWRVKSRIWTVMSRELGNGLLLSKTKGLLLLGVFYCKRGNIRGGLNFAMFAVDDFSAKLKPPRSFYNTAVYSYLLLHVHLKSQIPRNLNHRERSSSRKPRNFSTAKLKPFTVYPVRTCQFFFSLEFFFVSRNITYTKMYWKSFICKALVW